jgi:hypothetical protein
VANEDEKETEWTKRSMIQVTQETKASKYNSLAGLPPGNKKSSKLSEPVELQQEQEPLIWMQN